MPTACGASAADASRRRGKCQDRKHRRSRSVRLALIFSATASGRSELNSAYHWDSSARRALSICRETVMLPSASTFATAVSAPEVTLPSAYWMPPQPRETISPRPRIGHQGQIMSSEPVQESRQSGGKAFPGGVF